jgi:hypothetical protein
MSDKIEEDIEMEEDGGYEFTYNPTPADEAAATQFAKIIMVIVVIAMLFAGGVGYLLCYLNNN